MIGACCVHKVVHKTRIHVFSPIFQGLIGHMAQSIFDVFGNIWNILDGFQHITMHVSIVVKWRNVLWWKSAPASRRNNRSWVLWTISLYPWTFLVNFCGKLFAIVDAWIEHVVISALLAIAYTFQKIISFSVQFQPPTFQPSSQLFHSVFLRLSFEFRSRYTIPTR